MDSGHALRIYPNLVAEFNPTAPDQVWVADITYIRLPTAFAFLACVLDAWSRRCVGWHLSMSWRGLVPVDQSTTPTSYELRRGPAACCGGVCDDGTSGSSIDWNRLCLELLRCASEAPSRRIALDFFPRSATVRGIRSATCGDRIAPSSRSVVASRIAGLQ